MALMYVSNQHTIRPLTQRLPIPRPAIRFPSAIREVSDLLALVISIYALINLISVRFVVDGPSMEPHFYTGQFLIISRLHYIFGQPARGDIAVFHFPDNPNEDYLKRVIGLPGEVVTIRDGQILINGVILDEPYILDPCQPTWCSDNHWQLGMDEYFFLGDNRNQSSDSRDFGPVKRQFIVGKVLFRYWPLENFGYIDTNAYPRTGG